MLARKNRFNKSYQVRYILKNGHSIKSGPFLFKYVSKDSVQPAKIAVIVSKKVHKSAVVRNRIRRRVFDTLRTQDEQLVGFDLAVMVYAANVGHMDYQELHGLIEENIDKISTSKT